MIFCLLAISQILILPSLAQERVRTASGQLLISSYRRAPEAFFYLGPFQEIVVGTASVEYDDNVNLSTNKISDLSFSQAIGLNTTWVISQLNQLKLDVGGELTENFYGDGRSRVTFTIDPDSILEFKFLISDVQVRLYNQFSYTQNPTTDPTATNTANLNNLTNTTGAVVDTDLNIAVLSLAADYTYNSQSGQNNQGQANAGTTGTRETFRAGPTLTFRLSQTILYGIDAVGTRSTGVHASNVNSLNFGPFIKGKLGRYFDFDLGGGPTLIDTKPSIPANYYLFGAIRYQINRHWQLLASASHELIFTTGTDLTEQNLFKLGTQLDLTRSISFSTSPFVNFGDTKTSSAGSGLSTGTYTQFGIEATLGWKPRKRWSTGLSYNFIRREAPSTAGAGSNNYIQNTITGSISYSF